MARFGFTTFDRGYGVDQAAMPVALRSLVQPWTPPS
jgi:hypothetical protein